MFIVGILLGFVLGVVTLVLLFFFLVAQDGEKQVETKFRLDMSNNKTEEISPPQRPPKKGLSESCHWFNLIIQKVFEEHVNCPAWKERIMRKLRKAINSGKRPNFIVKIF